MTSSSFPTQGKFNTHRWRPLRQRAIHFNFVFEAVVGPAASLMISFVLKTMSKRCSIISAHVCFDSHHGHLVEFFAVVRDLAVLDSKLVPNTICE